VFEAGADVNEKGPNTVRQGPRGKDCNKRARGARAAALLLLAGLALLAGCASGGDPSPLIAATPVEREFAAAAITWDVNKDGDVTCDVAAVRHQPLREANRDGNLTRDAW